MRHRSFLFTPATRLDRLKKARKSGTDWVIVDLEDGVGPHEKSRARQAAQNHLRGMEESEANRLAVRINALSTRDGIYDVNALLGISRWPDMLVLPKVESAKEISQIRSVATEQGQSPIILVVLETAIGVDRAASIVRDCGPDIVVGYGSADHAAQTGGTMSAAALAWSRGQIVNACAVAGLPAVDGAFLDYKDTDGLEEEARLVKDLGFSGKIAIHPCQIAAINAAFTPSNQEVETARAIVEAARKAQSGAFSFNGKMVDAPVLAQANRIIDAYQEDM